MEKTTSKKQIIIMAAVAVTMGKSYVDDAGAQAAFEDMAKEFKSQLISMVKPINDIF